MNTISPFPPPCPFDTPADQLARAERLAGAVRFSELNPQKVRWLWPDRIPLGHVTLLVADPGAGKSLVALDIAARVSRGGPWPDANDEARKTNDESSPHSSFDIRHSSFENSPNPQSATQNPHSPISPSPPLPNSPSSVLLLTIEDHFADTVRPRLDALGADCSRILGLSHVPGEGVFTMSRPFAINRDLNRLGMLVSELADCRLVILDPITAFFGDTGNRSTSNVWKVLSALARLASSGNFAVLAISHLRKKEGAAIYRALGSLAFIASARAAWTIASDPEGPNWRLLLPLKNNLAPDAKGLAFTIESNEANRAPVIRWLPDTIEARAEAVLSPNRQPGRPDNERRYAADWLRHHLSRRQSPVRKIREAAEAHGITWGTLRRAFRELGAEAVYEREDGRIRWDWKLPVIGAQNSRGEFCAPMSNTDNFAAP